MKKKVINQDKYSKSSNKKAVAYLLALSLGLANVSAYAENKYVEKNIGFHDEYDEFLEYNVLNSIYQKQMNYLSDVINDLNIFYKTVDINDIIKTAYPSAYSVLNYDFNCYEISNGSDYKEFLPKRDLDINSFVDLIKENNHLIKSLNIKSSGTGRDPEYGIIKDPNSSLGFRVKTEEDNNLIESYSNIISGVDTLQSEVVNYLDYLIASKKNEVIKKYENK